MAIKSYPFHVLLETEYLTRLCVLVEFSLSFFSFSLVNELRPPFCINYTLRDTLQWNFGGNIFSFLGSLLKRSIFSGKKVKNFYSQWSRKPFRNLKNLWCVDCVFRLLSWIVEQNVILQIVKWLGTHVSAISLLIKVSVMKCLGLDSENHSAISV